MSTQLPVINWNKYEPPMSDWDTVEIEEKVVDWKNDKFVQVSEDSLTLYCTMEEIQTMKTILNNRHDDNNDDDDDHSCVETTKKKFTCCSGPDRLVLKYEEYTLVHSIDLRKCSGQQLKTCVAPLMGLTPDRVSMFMDKTSIIDKLLYEQGIRSSQTIQVIKT